MTSIATMAEMVTIALGPEAERETRSPAAIAVLEVLPSPTLVTLVVPGLFNLHCLEG
ncbi:MAG: hypothetical protein KME47_24175 [Nodosilinea sp. WJT8-NPBG4]|nr:hypothetical protein [Nodosilinea sp. WJT8-NPBG4]